MQQIKFGPLEFVARADRTLWHRESCTLFLSDPHLGKGAHFERAEAFRFLISVKLRT